MERSDGAGQESEPLTRKLTPSTDLETQQEPDQSVENGMVVDREDVTCSIRLYNLGFRIRLLGYSTVCLAYLLALAVGGFAQELVLPYMMKRMQEDLPWYTSFTCFWVFPTVFVLQSTWVDGALDLFLDAMSNPCLLHFRRVFTGMDIGLSLPRLDKLIMFIFEGVPIMSVVGEFLFFGGPKWERGPIALFADYARGGVLATFILATAAVVARFLVKLGRCTNYHREFHIRRLGMAWRDEIFEPSRNQRESWTPNPNMYRNTFDSVAENRNFDVVDLRKSLKTWGIAHLVMIAISVCFVKVFKSQSLESWHILSGMVAVLAALIFQYIFLRCFRGRSVLGSGYFACLMMALLFASLGLWLNFADPFETSDGGSNMFTPPPEGSSTALEAPIKPDMYPVCLSRWGNSVSTPQEYKLTIIDIALFADAVYKGDKETMMEIVKNFTINTPLAGTKLVNSSRSTRPGAWSVFEIPELKMRIVAVRGTQKSGCLLFDLNLWGTIATLEVFRLLVPIFDDLPTWSIRRLVGFSLAELFGSGKVWTDLESVTNYYKNVSDGDGYGLLITGHSLGGGLASIIGAHLRIPAVAFSAPGEFYSLYKFNMTEREVEHTLVNVIPERDIVPQIDYQAGMSEQHIECSATGMGAIFHCHATGRTICELYRSCNDTRGREYDERFRKHHDPDNMCNPKR